MPFDWWKPTIPEAYRHTFARKHDHMLLEDVRRRAQILRSLGYPRAYARARVHANVRWEFDPRPAPAVVKKFDEIVDDVYRAK
jgi:hypothetical protein